MKYTITDANAADATAIAALHADSWRASYRGILPDAFLDDQLDENRRLLWQERFRPLHHNGLVVLTAADGNEILGFASVFLHADDTWGALLDNLHVAPGATGQGIGTELLRAARRRAAAMAGERLHLWVFEENAGARRFYERHGAKAVERQIVEVIPGVHVPEVRYVFDARFL